MGMGSGCVAFANCRVGRERVSSRSSSGWFHVVRASCYVWDGRSSVHTGVRIVKVNCARPELDLGPVAQRIEQQPSKLKVAGSIPAGVAMISIT
jgi:hypothetical protein